MFINKLDISTNVWCEIAGNFSKSENVENVGNNLKVLERIGSESSEAEVYRIEVEGRE